MKNIEVYYNATTTMIKKRIISIIVAIVVLSLTVLIFHSCGKRGGHQMTFGNPTVVTSFANTMTLDVGDAETLDIDAIGALDLISMDSILLVVTRRDSNVVVVLDFNTLESKGEYLRHGNGPREIQPFFYPYRYGNRFYGNRDSAYVDFCNGMKNNLRWNVTAAFNDSEEVVEELPVSASEMSMFRFILNDSTTLLMRLVDNNTRLVRELVVNGENRTPVFLEKLNRAKVETENDGFIFNALASRVEYNPELDIVAEISLYQNVLNLYSLHTDYHKSFQIGKEPVSVSDVETALKNPFKDPQTVWYTMSSTDYIAILYDDDRGSRRILMFQWDGTPFYEIKLTEKVSAFDINKNTIITLNKDTEEIRRYELL